VLTGVRVQLAPDPDRDGDGLPNDWELANEFDPDSAEGDHGAQGDPDGDGAGNRHEYLAGTDPRDPASVLAMWLTPLGDQWWEIGWRTEMGLQYQLETSSDGSLSFAPVDSPRAAAGIQDSYRQHFDGGSRLFRVRRVE
jgi:hypothetical protein